MYGVMRFITMLNCDPTGAWAMVCASPQPKALMSRLSWMVWTVPVMGVRLMQTIRVVRGRSLLPAHISTTNGISASGGIEPSAAIPDDMAYEPSG